MCPQENFSPNEGVINLMNVILHFDHAETVTRVRSVLDAHKLVNLLDYLIHSKNALHQGATRNAGLLASEIFARVSIVVLPYFFNGNRKPHHYTQPDTSHIEILCQTIFAGRILDHRYIVPVVGLMEVNGGILVVNGGAHYDVLLMKEWRLRSNPSSVIVIQIASESNSVFPFNGRRTVSSIFFSTLGRL
ncbi:hypothetical protein M378DRAFT_167570 [Amanita muscaria Koide BX008]|uniref:Uncharacterized protein n=1 Tax=Amanita muscaria (strain Koide BX008) TaxID=946122 RepID=A0A0C2WX05_AMAMK|nr:hypothetical protein M378DRAFT_167570 [Amanita muscaria Koide BX008]